MAWETWVTYGYGINISEDIEDDTITVEKLENLISLSKNMEKKYKHFRECLHTELGSDDVGVDDILERFVDEETTLGYYGLASLLKDIIFDVENIDFTVADDYNGVTYLLYSPQYPWNLTEKEMEFTEDKVRQIFKKYISIVTDKDYMVDYFSVEKGNELH